MKSNALEIVTICGAFLVPEKEATMSEIRFSSKEHEKFFYQMLAKCGKHDSYYSSFFYCVGISEDTRNHVDRMFDCGYAPYFYEAIRIKYPEYCRELPQVSKKETNHER